ncbi:MAG: transporter, partial [Candidatus Sulfotelmatobacter sp.]
MIFQKVIQGAFIVLAVTIGLATAQDTSLSSTAVRQSLDDAWWTGPMLAPNATTLPRGHLLIEPYLYDLISAHANGLGSLTYINYGFRDRLTVGLIPTAGFNVANSGPSSSSVELGDLTVQGQYRLAKFREGSSVPATSVVVQETFPTGKYDRLGDRPNGLGSGAYTTTLAL